MWVDDWLSDGVIIEIGCLKACGAIEDILVVLEDG
jgi:hypothetical protein